MYKETYFAVVLKVNGANGIMHVFGVKFLLLRVSVKLLIVIKFMNESNGFHLII